MRDRIEQPSALPAEFAERVGDPIDYADRVAWSRARDRYRKLERPMPKIEHVLLDYSRHFLVVDGLRGPVCDFSGLPATHPSGFIRYRPDAYGVPREVLGRLLCVSPIEVEDKEAERPTDVAARWVEFTRASQAAIDAIIARYPEAK